MADEIGALRALLSASAAAFEGDMQRASKAVGANTNIMVKGLWMAEAAGNKLHKRINLLRNAAIVAAVTGLYLATKRATDFAAAMLSTAEKIGLTVEAYQELKFAAGQSEVSVEDFDASMQKFTKNIGAAIAGGAQSQMAKFFTQMGSSFSQLEKQTPEETLNKFIDSFNRLKNSALQSTAATTAFGKGGMAMIPFLKEGTASINEMRQKAIELGLVLDGKTLKAAKDAGDRFKIMDEVMKIAGTRIALAFVPAFEELAKLVADKTFIDGMKAIAFVLEGMIKLLHDFGPEIAAASAAFATFAATKGNLLATAGAFLVVEGSLRGLAMANQDAAKKAAESGEAHGRLGKEFGKLGLDTDGAKDKIREHTKEMQFNALATQQLIDHYIDFSGRVQEMEIDIKLENEAIKQHINLGTAQGRAWRDAFRLQEQMNQKYQETKKVVDDTRTPIEQYTQDVEELNRVLGPDGQRNPELYARGLDKLQDKLRDARSGMKGLEGASKDVGDAFTDFIDEAVLGTGKFSDALYSLFQDIQKIVFRKTISEPLGNAVADLFGGITGGSGGSSKSGGIGNWLNNAFSGVGDWFSSIFRADGGPVMAGQSYIVGEQGPERFTPAVSGHITSTADSGLGGGNVYQIDARGADEGAVRRIGGALVSLAGPGVTERRILNARQRGVRM